MASECVSRKSIKIQYLLSDRINPLQLIGEGFDCKDLTTLFLSTPVRFSGRVVQYLGRILRPAPGKDRARVFDYVDVHVPPLIKAARARKKVYGV